MLEDPSQELDAGRDPVPAKHVRSAAALPNPGAVTSSAMNGADTSLSGRVSFGIRDIGTWAFETIEGDDEWGTLTAVDLKARCTKT